MAGAWGRGRGVVIILKAHPNGENRRLAMVEDWNRLTVLLNRLDSAGDIQARVYDLVYAELRAIAHRLLSQETENPYQATELLHETYVKKLRRMRIPIRDRQHFYALATRAMRQVLIEDARRRRAEKPVTPAQPRPPG